MLVLSLFNVFLTIPTKNALGLESSFVYFASFISWKIHVDMGNIIQKIN